MYTAQHVAGGGLRWRKLRGRFEDDAASLAATDVGFHPWRLAVFGLNQNCGITRDACCYMQSMRGLFYSADS